MVNNRLAWIDVARGVGILLVVIGHLSEGIKPLHNIIYSFHMPLFFFLSGYCYRSNNIIWMTFLKKKWSTLIVPWICLGTLVYIFRAITVSDFASEFRTFQSILFSIDALWFLPILFLCNVMQKSILEIGRKNIQITITCLLLIVGSILSYLNIRDELAISSSLIGSFFCMVGYYLRQQDQLMESKWFKLCMFVLYFLLSVAYISYPSTNMMFNTYEPFIVATVIRAIAGCLFFCFLCQYLTKYTSCVQTLGQNTLTLLAFHLYFYEMFKHFLEGRIKYDNFASLVLMFIGVYILDRIFAHLCPWVIGKK